MPKLLTVLISTLPLLLGLSSAPAQEKKSKTTLEEDWRALCRYKWVNDDPKKAWELLDEGWKKYLERQGVQGWSRIEVSFADGRKDKKEYRMWHDHYAVGKKGKEKPHQRAFGVLIDLGEEKGGRFLLLGIGAGKESATKIRYFLKDNYLTLDGSQGDAEKMMPKVFTGKYKGVERTK
jgi:hypothetical protein